MSIGSIGLLVTAYLVGLGAAFLTLQIKYEGSFNC